MYVATVLPEKQLKYVLERDRFFETDDCGDYRNKKTRAYFNEEMFNMCLHDVSLVDEIVFSKLYDYICSDRWCWKKEWLIPHTIKEV